jgi:hypothetical protein
MTSDIVSSLEVIAGRKKQLELISRNYSLIMFAPYTTS